MRLRVLLAACSIFSGGGAVMTPAIAASPESNGIGRVGLRLSICSGDDVWEWLGDKMNVASWRALHEQCGWSTAFQAPEFYRVWFQHYGAQWKAVLVLGHDDRGTLAALMPLAVAGGVVTGVGAHQAEYHGWVGSESCPAGFFRDACAAVLNTFPDHRLSLRFLPQGAPKEALDTLAGSDRRAIALVQDRPLLALDEAAISETLKKKGNRSKINRLKRLGPLSFRRMDADEFERRVDDVGAMCDFRQGAVNDSCPFIDDPQKRVFHVDWARSMPNELHVNGMFVGDQLISVLIFALSKGEAHIAITAHSPAYAEHSPGKIHIYEAGLLLAREGYAAVDMTPGGDEWKFRFATRTDRVVDLTVYPTLTKANLVRLRRAVSSALRTPLARLRELLATAKVSKVEAPDGETASYSMKATVPRGDGADVRVNALAELLKFGPAVSGLSRQVFLSRALARMETGERCYSLAGHGGISALGWKGGEAPRIRLSDFSARTDVDTREAYAALARHMLAGDEGTVVEVSVATSDSELQAAVERLGLQRASP